MQRTVNFITMHVQLLHILQTVLMVGFSPFYKIVRGSSQYQSINEPTKRKQGIIRYDKSN